MGKGVGGRALRGISSCLKVTDCSGLGKCLKIFHFNWNFWNFKYFSAFRYFFIKSIETLKSSKQFGLLVLTLLTDWCKISSLYLVLVQNYWTWTLDHLSKKAFFWSNPYKIEVMITSLIQMLQLLNFGHMTTSIIYVMWQNFVVDVIDRIYDVVTFFKKYLYFKKGCGSHFCWHHQNFNHVYYNDP